MSDRIPLKYWWSDDRKWFCILVDDGISKATISLTPEQASLLSMNALPPEYPSDDDKALVGRVKSSIDIRLNNALCEMKPEHDDSITGFNEAWDIVRETFAELVRP